jgi:hypothetical protein
MGSNSRIFSACRYFLRTTKGSPSWLRTTTITTRTLPPSPNPSTHGCPVGEKLAGILYHWYSTTPSNEAAYALQALRQDHYSAEDVRRLMIAAYADQDMPPDLRTRIMDFLLAEWWPSESSLSGSSFFQLPLLFSGHIVLLVDLYRLVD